MAMQVAVNQHMTQKNGVGMGGAVGTYGGTSAAVPGVSADTKPQRTGLFVYLIVCLLVYFCLCIYVFTLVLQSFYIFLIWF